jgi:hypothetical protein
MSGSRHGSSANAGGPVVPALDRFLQPEMPVTPALLSTLAALGSATIATSLHLPDAGMVLLILSGCLGVVTIINATGVFNKALYWVINTIDYPDHRLRKHIAYKRCSQG